MKNHNKGFAMPLLIALVVVVLVIVGGVIYYYSKQASTPTQEQNQNLLGGDKDIHGCVGSAGYAWCEAKQKCLREWEEKCESGETKNNLPGSGGMGKG